MLTLSPQGTNSCNNSIFSCCPLKVFSAQTFSSIPSTSQPILLLLQEINFGYCRYEISDTIFWFLGHGTAGVFFLVFFLPSRTFKIRNSMYLTGHSYFLRGIFPIKGVGSKKCGVLVTSLENQRGKKKKRLLDFCAPNLTAWFCSDAMESMESSLWKWKGKEKLIFFYLKSSANCCYFRTWLFFRILQIILYSELVI